MIYVPKNRHQLVEYIVQQNTIYLIQTHFFTMHLLRLIAPHIPVRSYSLVPNEVVIVFVVS